MPPGKSVPPDPDRGRGVLEDRDEFHADPPIRVEDLVLHAYLRVKQVIADSPSGGSLAEVRAEHAVDYYLPRHSRRSIRFTISPSEAPKANDLLEVIVRRIPDAEEEREG